MRRWRATALLAVGVVIGVSMMATPAGGHVAGWVHNWNVHIKPRADVRYVNVGEGVARPARISSTGNIALPVGTTTVESLSLPAGKYLVLGRTIIQNQSGTDHIVRCNISPTTSTQDIAILIATGTEDTLNISELESFGAPTTVNMRCESFTAAATAFRVVLIAVPLAGTLVQ
jgi:hypothetical protein